MWHWRPKKLPKKYQFLGKLFLVFFSMHCMVLVAIFCIDHSNTVHTIHVGRTLIDSDAKIIFCPLQKTVKQKSRVSTQKRAKKSKAKPKKKIAKPTSTKKTTLKVDKPKPKKKVAPPKKKPVKKIATKPVAQKEKPVCARATQPSPKAMAGTASNKPKAKQPEKPVEKKAKDAKPTETQVDAVDEHIVYMGREDMKMHRIGLQVQREIENHWSPPPGLPKDLSCRVKMRIAGNGKVEAEMIERSGVLVYDICARDAVLASKLPKSLWRKAFVVVL